MSNTGFISMAPELAAIEAQIIVVDGVVDANAVILSDIHDTDLPAVGVIAAANEVILTDIHDTDLPAVGAIAAANEVILTDIHDTDLPAVATAIGALKFRGQFKIALYDAAPGDTAFHDVLNHSGSGKVFLIMVRGTTSGCDIRITADGLASNDQGFAAGTTYFIKMGAPAAPAGIAIAIDASYQTFKMEYSNTMLVQISQTNGGNNMACAVFYNEDT